MGTAATVGRRALVEHVKDCISRTNACLVATQEIHEQHNALALQVGADVKALTKRIDGVSTIAVNAEAWCVHQDAAISAHEGQLINLELEIASFVSGLTFWQRLRWLIRGFPSVPVVLFTKQPNAEITQEMMAR